MADQAIECPVWVGYIGPACALDKALHAIGCELCSKSTYVEKQGGRRVCDVADSEH